MLALLEFFWGTPASTVGNFYYDFSAAVNGIGTSASPFNTWAGTVVVAGATYYFRRGTTCDDTTFTLDTAGTALLPVTYTSYYNSDGTDDATIARPIIANTAPLNTSATTRDYNVIENWDIRCPALTVATDRAAIFLGDGDTIYNCIIHSNIGCIKAADKSNITVTGNTLHGVSHINTFNNSVLSIVDAIATSNATITNNTILHYGGGSTIAHGARIEVTGAIGLVNLLVEGNTIRPAANHQRLLPGYGFINETENMEQPMLPGYGIVNRPTRIYSINHSSHGIRLFRGQGATVTSNTINGFQDAIFAVGNGATVAATYSYNTLSYNMHFGLHLTTDMVGCTIEHNTCNYNGINVNDGVLFAYGRGIELSSAAGQSRCSGHTIRYNTCSYNFNYGGPSDNGSEGVGIGLDDATDKCLVSGNTLSYNQGNGVQLYGGTLGAGSPAIVSTNNNVVANLFISNCTSSITSKRSGGTYTNLFDAHINMASTRGLTSYIANNVFTGTTRCGTSQDYNCLLVTQANNIFNGTAHAIRFSTLQVPVGYGTFNNDFFGVGQNYSNNTVDGNGVPTFPNIAYTGTLDYTFDPLLDSSYRPSHISPALDVGLHIGSFADFEGTFFSNPPDIGMYEVLYIQPPSPPPPAIAPLPAGSGREKDYEMLPDSYWEDREARMLAELKKSNPLTPERVRVLDTEVAAAIDRVTAEHDYLMANLLKLDSVAELKAVADHIHSLGEQITSLKSRLYKWQVVLDKQDS